MFNVMSPLEKNPDVCFCSYRAKHNRLITSLPRAMPWAKSF
jgi:hypothetical protein